MIKIGKYPSVKIKNSEYSIFIKFDYNQDILNKVKSLPVRFYEPTNKVWEIPISDIDRLINLFKVDNIYLFNDIPEFTKYLQDNIYKSTNKKNTAELIEYYKTVQPLVDYDFKTKPDGHQIEAFNKALELDSLFITDVMGLGKTKQAIDIMDYRKTTGQVKHVLVICGVNGLKYNWNNIEIPKHSRNNCQVIDGTKKKRIEKLQSYWMFFYNIINIESLRDKDIMKYLVALCNNGKINGIIVDEFHRANNHKSQQGQGLRELDAKYKIALSGTPITKHINKSWNMLNWMGLENATYWNFVKRYCELGGYSGWDVIGYKTHMLNELHERFDKFQIRRTKDILQLPPKTYQTIYVDMTTDEHNEYMQIKRGIIVDMESGGTSEISPLTAIIKLRQFTDKVKVRALKETIEELNDNNEPCVVFSYYKDGLYSLIDEVRNYNPLLLTGDIIKSEDKQKVIQSFQEESKSNILLGTIQALGTGYTLTRAQYVLFLNKSWVCTDNEQAEDRCHRRGTTGNVTIISYIVKNSVDERVEEILANDKIYIDKVVDGIPVYKSNKSVWSKLMED